MENQFKFSRLAALFLAEIIRSRQISLKRAAEISSLVMDALPSLDTEEKTLSFLTEMERDFEEVGVLKHALCFRYDDADIHVYEQEIKNFAAELFQSNMVASSRFLQDAVQADMDIQKLCIKYPDFCQYLLLDTEKMPLLKRLDLSY